MNQTKPKTLEQILKQFDEEFGVNKWPSGQEFGYSSTPDKFKGFIRTSITTLLESLKRERWNAEEHGEGHLFEEGYNTAAQELEEDINKILGKKE